MINLLITADYELFLGRNFLSDDEVLFAPTRGLLDLSRRIDVPITFFADVCSVWAHRDSGIEEYPHLFEQQLCDAVRDSHDVQLHLHPHWLFSSFRDGEWHVSTDRMYMAELGYDDAHMSAPAVIRHGIDYLNRLLQPVNSDYKCIAFRAAGLALQPREQELISALLENGILLDSSVVKGVKFKLDTIEIDYSNAPTSANWFMNPETGVTIPSTSGLFEIPIGTFKMDILNRLEFIWRRARSVRMLRGTGISRSQRQSTLANVKTLIKYNLRYLYTNPWFNLSCDTKGYDLKMLLTGFNDYIARHSDSDSIFVSLINHPKMMFTPQLELLESFVTAMRNKYRDRIRFITFSEALKQIRSD